MAVNTEVFRNELKSVLMQAQELGFVAVEVNSGNLHSRVGDYPGPDHRMPICCEVMRGEMKFGDEVVKQPESGKGASLVIRYQLPR